LPDPSSSRSFPSSQDDLAAIADIVDVHITDFTQLLEDDDVRGIPTDAVIVTETRDGVPSEGNDVREDKKRESDSGEHLGPGSKTVLPGTPTKKKRKDSLSPVPSTPLPLSQQENNSSPKKRVKSKEDKSQVSSSISYLLPSSLSQDDIIDSPFDSPSGSTEIETESSPQKKKRKSRVMAVKPSLASKSLKFGPSLTSMASMPSVPSASSASSSSTTSLAGRQEAQTWQESVRSTLKHAVTKNIEDAPDSHRSKKSSPSGAGKNKTPKTSLSKLRTKGPKALVIPANATLGKVKETARDVRTQNAFTLLMGKKS